MFSQEVSAGFVHGFEVEAGVAALPGIGRHEGVFFAVDEVGIYFKTMSKTILKKGVCK